MRGVVSYGVVPGSDKSISLYIDGVYIGSATGSAFELPDIDRIEVLKGPQGTLFGRNATAGAVNVITRDPPGRFGVRQDFTVGNYDQFRSRTRIDLPTWHDLSASVNFVHDQRQGDIKNLGAGTVWNYSASPGAHEGVLTSPKYLGDKNSNSVYAAVKYKPTDDLTITNKFDWTENHGTPEGVGSLGLSPTYSGTLAFLGVTPTTLSVDPTRPKAVNNSFTTPSYDNAWGDAVVVQYRVNENLSFKDIAAYRYSYTWANYQLDGLGGLTLGGLPFTFLTDSSQSVAKQFSNEAQVNYNSQFVTVTAGALYFHLITRAGGPEGLPNNFAFSVLPGGVIPTGDSSAFNKASSYAGYVQIEGHLTSQLDIVGGYRLTKDDKSGSLDLPSQVLDFSYTKTKPSYSIGLNYKPWSNVLLYTKYSNAFVSGGNVGGLPFLPETAHSYEGGVKADLLNRRLRANLAVWDVTYNDLQAANSGAAVQQINPIFAQVGTVVVDSGNGHAKGFELELTALPMRGLTLNAGIGDTDFNYTKVSPILGNLQTVLPYLRPKWTADLSGQYETEPLFDEVRMLARIDANYRSKERLDTYSSVNPSFVDNYTPGTWVVNARLALEHVELAHTNVDLALWVKNLTDDKSPLFADFIPFAPPAVAFASTSYQPARTFGIDISFTY
jgi:iron complex outermembrane receptor protein